MKNIITKLGSVILTGIVFAVVGPIWLIIESIVVMIALYKHIEYNCPVSSEISTMNDWIFELVFGN